MNVMNVLPRSSEPGARSYVLKREQWLPLPSDDVFGFFAEASNLEAITPPWLGFRILSPRPVAMHAQARITYELRWHGFPLRWLTEIETWDPPREFVDIQVRGPYRLWHHTHQFGAKDGGTLMRDVVRYRLPLGLVGRLANAWLVRRELDAIFNYRASKVAEILAVGVGR